MAIEWTTQASQILAAQITGAWAEKKRATILELVRAHIERRAEGTVWELPHTGSFNAYHGRGKGKQGWKHDPVFAAALKEVDALAAGYQAQLRAEATAEAMRKRSEALERAANNLALSAPLAVTALVRQLADQGDASLSAERASLAIRAAIAILDRAGLETAAKAQTQTVTVTADEWRQQAAARRAQAEATLAEFDDQPEPAPIDQEPQP